jgi:hypothetical protein
MMNVYQSDFELMSAMFISSRRNIYLIKRHNCLCQLWKTIQGKEESRKVFKLGVRSSIQRSDTFHRLISQQKPHIGPCMYHLPVLLEPRYLITSWVQVTKEGKSEKLCSLAYSDHIEFREIMLLYIYPSIHPSIYLFSHLSIYFSIYISMCLSIHLSIYVPIYLPMYVCIYLWN